jgi:hypothetical protein
MVLELLENVRFQSQNSKFAYAQFQKNQHQDEDEPRMNTGSLVFALDVGSKRYIGTYHIVVEEVIVRDCVLGYNSVSILGFHKKPEVEILHKYRKKDSRWYHSVEGIHKRLNHRLAAL